MRKLRDTNSYSPSNLSNCLITGLLLSGSSLLMRSRLLLSASSLLVQSRLLLPSLLMWSRLLFWLLPSSSLLPPWDFLGGAGVLSSMNSLSREWWRMCEGVQVMKAGPLDSERGEMMGDMKPKSEGGAMGTSSSVPNREETAVAAFRNIWIGAND